MYICLCNSVTEGDIKQAVEKGANCMHHLRSELNCSMQCGGCQERAEACLDEAIEKQMAHVESSFS